MRENARTDTKAMLEFPGRAQMSSHLFVGVSKSIIGTINNSG